MILALLRFFRGSVTLEARSAAPERFVNACRAHGVALWGLAGLSADRLRLTLRRRDLARAERLAARCQCELTELSRRGPRELLAPLRSRRALLATALLCAAAALLSSCFLWRITISGCERLDRRALERELASLGLRRGVWLSHLDCADVCLELMRAHDELKYVTINIRGNTAAVAVVERSGNAPASDEPCDIVCDRDGLVVSLDVRRGEPAVAPGDAVLRGEVLISGEGVHAEGEVLVRTMRTVRAALPCEMAGVGATGRSVTRWTLLLGTRTIPLYPVEKEPFTWYDKDRAVLPREDGGFCLPVRLIRETWRETESFELALDEDRCARLLERACRQRLAVLTGGGETVASSFSFVAAPGRVLGSLTAECLEKAGEERSCRNTSPSGAY